jgi:hypothetical protein
MSILQRNGADCRSTAAQESAERAGLFGSGYDAREEWNQFLPERLMQMIDKSAAQVFVIAGGECGRNGAGISAIFDRPSPLNF